MADFASIIAQHQGKDMPPEQAKRLGQAAGDNMGDEHKDFLATVMSLLDKGEIDTMHPETFLKRDVYDALSEEWKSKVDRTLPNIADLLWRIEEFYRRKDTPNASPELQTMIEHLWQMKERIEREHDVFKF